MNDDVCRTNEVLGPFVIASPAAFSGKRANERRAFRADSLGRHLRVKLQKDLILWDTQFSKVPAVLDQLILTARVRV
jgi:hypothetical protein